MPLTNICVKRLNMGNINETNTANTNEIKSVIPPKGEKVRFIIGCVFSAIALLINIFFIVVSIDSIFTSGQLTNIEYALTSIITVLMFIIWAVSALPSCIIAVLLLGVKNDFNKKVSKILIIVTVLTTVLCGVLIYFTPGFITSNVSNLITSQVI